MPLGFDVLHHDLHRARHRDRHAGARRGPSPARRGPGAGSPASGVRPDAARVTARLYLLALAARYLRDQQTEAGAALGDVESWLLPALDAPPRRRPTPPRPDPP